MIVNCPKCNLCHDCQNGKHYTCSCGAEFIADESGKVILLPSEAPAETPCTPAPDDGTLANSNLKKRKRRSSEWFGCIGCLLMLLCPFAIIYALLNIFFSQYISQYHEDSCYRLVALNKGGNASIWNPIRALLPGTSADNAGEYAKKQLIDASKPIDREKWNALRVRFYFDSGPERVLAEAEAAGGEIGARAKKFRAELRRERREVFLKAANEPFAVK